MKFDIMFFTETDHGTVGESAENVETKTVECTKEFTFRTKLCTYTPTYGWTTNTSTYQAQKISRVAVCRSTTVISTNMPPTQKFIEGVK